MTWARAALSRAVEATPRPFWQAFRGGLLWRGDGLSR